MQRTVFIRRSDTGARTLLSFVPDLMILLLLATAIYGVVKISHEWRTDYHPLTKIDLSIWALPEYTLLSGIRGSVAYVLSLLFTLVVGYAAARSARAERFIIPLLDILQSIPVLGFLPGLVLGLVALFPNSNIGLELAAILMIFTGQVWNMTFSFYSSLKSVPSEFIEASDVIGLSWWERLMRVELPFSAVNLIWNSLLSMAGGWFFLSACEAFTLGDKEFRLPGIGAYMAVAIAEGNKKAMVSGIIAMVLLIVSMDFFFWRPMLAWVQRFRLEDVPGVAPAEPLMRVVLRESRLLRWIKVEWRRYRFEQRERKAALARAALASRPVEVVQEEDDDAEVTGSIPERAIKLLGRQFRRQAQMIRRSRRLTHWVTNVLTLVFFGIIIWCAIRLVQTIWNVSFSVWVVLLRNAFWSLMRVLVAVTLSTLWTVPFGIWVGTSSRRIRAMQPVIQVLSSFPAPMLYPLALAAMFRTGMGFDIASMFLMMLGVQWYVLFNVLAGALRIPRELGYAISLMEVSTWDRWRRLYLPSVFPSLVTGWVTAAGGAWNATIIAEALTYGGDHLQTSGLGATISEAAATENFSLLAASLTLMVIIVILFNRAVWARVYELAQTRYRMDM